MAAPQGCRHPHSPPRPRTGRSPPGESLGMLRIPPGCCAEQSGWCRGQLSARLSLGTTHFAQHFGLHQPESPHLAQPTIIIIISPPHCCVSNTITTPGFAIEGNHTQFRCRVQVPQVGRLLTASCPARQATGAANKWHARTQIAAPVRRRVRNLLVCNRERLKKK